jgi:predicted ferric reductase
MLVRSAAVALALAGLGTGLCVPFFFESQSLYYKFGLDKALLQWGKAAGLAAAVLMVYQIIFVSRFRVLETHFTRKRLWAAHKTCGKLIALLVTLHPLLILGSDGFAFFPLEKRYWPEFTGIFLWMLILGIVGISVFQSRLPLSYRTWQALHRGGVPAAVCLVFIHAGFVSESFVSGFPRAGLFLTAGMAGVLFIRIYAKRLLNK